MIHFLNVALDEVGTALPNRSPDHTPSNFVNLEGAGG